MTDRTIISSGEVGGDYFTLKFSRRSNKNLQFYLDQFDINDYYIYKNTNVFREVSIEDFYKFKYSGYIFFKKSLYSNKDIDEWIDFIHSITTRTRYIVKPFPNKSVIKKIRVIQ